VEPLFFENILDILEAASKCENPVVIKKGPNID
jgi:hypothetical protein